MVLKKKQETSSYSSNFAYFPIRFEIHKMNFCLSVVSSRFHAHRMRQATRKLSKHKRNLKCKPRSPADEWKRDGEIEFGNENKSQWKWRHSEYPENQFRRFAPFPGLIYCAFLILIRNWFSRYFAKIQNESEHSIEYIYSSQWNTRRLLPEVT